MPDAPTSAPLHERYIARLKQRRWVAVLLVFAAIVTGVAGFTDSAKKLVGLFQPGAVEDPRQRLVKLDQPFTPEAYIAAAARGDEAAVQLYLKSGMPVDELSAQGTTALIAAALAHRAAVVQQLLAAKADQSRRGPRQSAALSIAATSGDVALTRLLLDAGPDLDLVRRAYVSAAAAGQLATLQLVAQQLGAAQGPVATEALWALAAGQSVGSGSADARAAVATFLLSAGADAQAVEAEDKRSTVLHRAAYNGQAAVARVLLDRGAAVDPRDADGATPLWWVAGVGNVAMAKLLIEHHADAKAAAKDGTTVMARARYNRDDEMVTLLRQQGAR